MRREYVKPRVVEHREGTNNKFGEAPSSFMDSIDGQDIAALVGKFGSPLFVLSERQMREKYRAMLREFSLQYPRVQFAWSYKTNYLRSVCALFHQEGAWAEVVSDFEYERAIDLGVPGDKIIFNGPAKSYEILKVAAENRSKIHADSMEEIFALERIAVELGRPVDVAIRINLDTGIQPIWSRFGFNLENQEACSAAARIRASGKLNLKGLHCHIGTFILDPGAYARAIQKLSMFARRLRDAHSTKLDYLDIGGGFPSTNTLHTQYLPGSQSNPPVSKYAEAICVELMKCAGMFQSPPLLILENGRALVDEAGYLVATVASRKRLPDGTAAIVLDAGVNLLYTSTWYKHDVVPAQACSDIMENTVIYGPMCMNIDVVRPQVFLPGLISGDRVVIKPVGAYNMTQWMQFIRYRPAIVMIDEHGTPHVVRRREDLDHMNSLESVPEALLVRKGRGRSRRT